MSQENDKTIAVGVEKLEISPPVKKIHSRRVSIFKISDEDKAKLAQYVTVKGFESCLVNRVVESDYERGTREKEEWCGKREDGRDYPGVAMWDSRTLFKLCNDISVNYEALYCAVDYLMVSLLEDSEKLRDSLILEGGLKRFERKVKAIKGCLSEGNRYQTRASVRLRSVTRKYPKNLH